MKVRTRSQIFSNAFKDSFMQGSLLIKNLLFMLSSKLYSCKVILFGYGVEGGPTRPDMHERSLQDFRDDELGAQTYYARALAADPTHLNLMEHLMEHQAADAPLDSGAQVRA